MFVKICPLCKKEFNTNREKQIFCNKSAQVDKGGTSLYTSPISSYDEC